MRMYTEEYENRGFPFRNFLLKLILIIIFHGTTHIPQKTAFFVDILDYLLIDSKISFTKQFFFNDFIKCNISRNMHLGI